MMYTASEKLAIIRLIEESELSVRRTLRQIKVSRISFYRLYNACEAVALNSLENRSRAGGQRWNRIPDLFRELIPEVALERPDLPIRELSWLITDTHDYFVLESSVYRIMRAHDLITSRPFTVMAASDKFQSPTSKTNELWQTYFTCFRVVGWCWYFLSTVLDDYSRCIINWQLTTSMAASSVTETLGDALRITGPSEAGLGTDPACYQIPAPVTSALNSSPGSNRRASSTRRPRRITR